LAFYHRILARQASGDPDYTDDVWPMWTIAAVELWMREVAGRLAGGQEEESCAMTMASTSEMQASASAAPGSRMRLRDCASTAALPS
jgi:hypothetical protein